MLVIPYPFEMIRGKCAKGKSHKFWKGGELVLREKAVLFYLFNIHGVFSQGMPTHIWKCVKIGQN